MHPKVVSFLAYRARAGWLLGVPAGDVGMDWLVGKGGTRVFFLVGDRVTRVKSHPTLEDAG